MTLNQLLNEVYSLGFESADELTEPFVFSTNRALKMIFSELGPQTRITLDITAGDEKSFDLGKVVKNPLMITSPPKDTRGAVICGAYCDGLSVTLPDSFVGKAVITYRVMPKSVTLDDGEHEIDVPPYLEHLLPLLTASFVLLDDDPEKADVYAQIYRNEARRTWRNYSLSQDSTYVDVTGWAT